MIAIHYNSESFDIGRDTVIHFKMESPAFIFEGMPAGFTFPFELPDSPKNRRLLGHPLRLHKKVEPGTTELEVVAYIAGRPWNALMKVNSSESGKITAVLTLGIGYLGYKLKDKMLTDIAAQYNIGATYAAAIAYLNTCISFKYPTYPMVVFPVKNSQMHKTYRRGRFQNGDTYYRSPSVSSWGLYDTDDDVAKINITPFFYFAEILDKILSEAGFTLGRSDFHSDADLIKVVMYNAEKYTPKGSNWAIIPPGDNIVEMGQHVPNKSQIEFLVGGIRNTFNMPAFVNNVTGIVDIISMDDLLHRPATREIRDCKHIFQQETAHENGWSLKWLFDGADASFNYHVKDVWKEAETIGTPADTYDDLLTPVTDGKTLRLVKDENTWYKLRLSASSGFDSRAIKPYTGPYTGSGRFSFNKYSYNAWQHYRNPYKPGRFVVQSSLCPMLTSSLIKTGGKDYRDWFKYPFCSIAPGREYGMRPILYHGYRENSITIVTWNLGLMTQDYEYPFASSDIYMRAPGVIAPEAGLAMRWGGTYGLVNRFWKPFMDWFTEGTRLNKFLSAMPGHEIHNIDFAEPYNILGQAHLIKSIEFDVSTSRISPVTIEAYQR
jgi:hypothetical protein